MIVIPVEIMDHKKHNHNEYLDCLLDIENNYFRNSSLLLYTNTPAFACHIKYLKTCMHAWPDNQALMLG